MMLDFSKTFKKYEALVSEVDKIFGAMQDAHRDCVRCEIHCCDCCYAVFDLTLIESVYINHHFNASLARRDRRRLLRRAERADRKFYQIKRKLQKMYLGEGKTPEEVLLQLAEERVPCPLLNDENVCDMYARRPITCRVYGIPTSIGGTAHICGKAGFKRGTAYPTVNLDNINDRLFELSKELLQEIGSNNSKIHMSLVPVSTALINTYDKEYFGI
ncbi:MAG: YkgJ family cysteine cluster protein [Deltaproteobacteria bacterium]|nr:YkgJ family cysteine cluster protein [Deltaproteobacteria bacterium]MBW2075327.1 YkgJ family cysteine cluster protein [Deltaproteobacteria bacterium]RLB80426.1 MAG: YkgJ family cysteine cluster protein [Deltaproteobacteria bacterium]